MAQIFSTSSHPYYPQDANIPGYLPNTSSLSDLSYRFAGLLGLTVLTAVLLATSLNPKLSRTEKSILGWFVLCTSLPKPSSSHTLVCELD